MRSLLLLSPVETESDPMNVTFDKLAPAVQNAVMVKFDTCENITVDMVISARIAAGRHGNIRRTYR